MFRFMLLGLAIFAADRWIVAGVPPSDRIVVTASQQSALAAAFRAERGREPSSDELQARLDRWIDDQVLYREALALGLDRKDVIVQRQLTQKMRFLIEDSSPLEEPDAAELQAWLDHHPERYGHPSTVSFQQVFLSRGRHGRALQSEAARVAKLLQQSPEAWVGLGDPFLVGQVVEAASRERVRREFGEGFANALDDRSSGLWSGPVASGFGLHLVRVTGRGRARPATLAEVGDQVRADLQAARRDERNRQALAGMRDRYRIDIEDSEG
jgi:hypothetical protein